MPSTFRTLERQAKAVNPTHEFEYPALQELTKPHIESFDTIWEPIGPNRPSLIELAVANLGRRRIFDGKGPNGMGGKIDYWISRVEVGRPTVSERDHDAVNRLVYPTECRERMISYKAKMTAELCWQVGTGGVNVETVNLGNLPVVVKSNRCNLRGMGPVDLIKHREEAEEMGGYFIVNGNEKIIRLLVAPKRNHVVSILRSSYQNRGPGFTSYATQIRCVREDQTAKTLTLHYLTTGQLMLRFSIRKQEYLVPVALLLKALTGATDREIFESLIQNRPDDTFIVDRVELMLRGVKQYAVYTREQCLSYIGDKFRVVLGVSEDVTNAEAGLTLLNKFVMVHLNDHRDKYNMLVYMIRKLYATVNGDCQVENPDSMQCQEVYMPGHIYLSIIKEKLDDFLNGIRAQIRSDIRRRPDAIDFYNASYFQRVIRRVPCDIGRKMEYFLATGNLVSKTGLDLQQTTGFTIVAEKLNFLRYISHFRCIHRGAFFAELKTTSVRKLLPESWGFMCPVHTPDGAPCGLLNHLTHTCRLTTRIVDTSDVEEALWDLGVTPGMPNLATKAKGQLVSVQIDGRIIGFCMAEAVGRIAGQLRTLKLTKNNPYRIPRDLEIGYVPSSHGGQWPGLFLFSTPARFTRPVTHLATGEEDILGPFEQVYMNIACIDQDIYPGITTHKEVLPTHMLSVVANLTPFCDFNQSPRNMYQCQMGKQTMGTPAQAIAYRTDNKLYQIQSGQTPLVRPSLYDKYGIDGYPNGTNAIVAVISYTGYDMEDAMILNKSSHERGFGYGTIYKTSEIDLSEFRKPGDPITNHFGIGPDKADLRGRVDDDGLPFIGSRLEDGDPLVAFFDDIQERTVIKKHKGEPCVVENVRLVAPEHGEAGQELQKVIITLRIPRSPIIGDKFSSRHGQKGVCSTKFPTIDMPFTESGLQPDVIINPHAFPSRMTIGMFVESIAGKAGALHGVAQDATPFQFTEDYTAADHFGEQLHAAGFSYHGNEPMYSGITGTELYADIYIGVVYYQRLRHMVNDKYQVRTTGPVDPLTMQPIKGRKRGGGIRLGEME
ncbi:hypothetical protein EV182_001684, partial [Spiromyces aspiralis]